MSTTSTLTADSIPGSAGLILVAPHQFPDLEREHSLAQEFGLPLVAAQSVNEFRRMLPHATLVLITPYATLSADDFTVMAMCRAVVRYGIGYDNIDVDAAKRAGIPVSIVPDASTTEVASHAFAMGLALVRRLPEGHAAIATGSWARRIAYEAPRFEDLRVGVIGMGRIGRHVARLYQSIGATVTVFDPYATPADFPTASLDELLVTSDVVSLHVPLNAATSDLVSAEVLARMPRTTVVVNVSRGGLVDETALAEALTTGSISGAALDTFRSEPLPADHPLRSAPNVILTPHIAWRSNRAVESLQQSAMDRARQALHGDPISDVVN
jgi:D-3-phosphoglycerate dehydrogenase